MSNTSVVTGKVRLSYAHLFEPHAQKGGGEPKYSTTILLPKSDTVTWQNIQNAIAAATQEGITKKWSGQQPAKIECAIYDGDGLRPSGEEPYGEECRGCWVFTAKSSQRPGIVDQRVQKILDSTLVYSGMYAYVDINFYPYNSNGRKGIGIGLNNVQKVADGEPFAGGRSATEAFKPINTSPAASPFQAAPAPTNPYQAAPQPTTNYLL